MEIKAILSLKDDDDENVLGISSRQSSPRHLEEKKTDYIDDDIDLHSCPYLAPASATADRTTDNFLSIS